jgi:hypothetical protein
MRHPLMSKDTAVPRTQAPLGRVAPGLVKP